MAGGKAKSVKSKQSGNQWLLSKAVELQRPDPLPAWDAENTHALEDLSERRLREIELYFIAYNEERGKIFRPIGRFGPRRAKALVQKGEKCYGSVTSKRQIFASRS